MYVIPSLISAVTTLKALSDHGCWNDQSAILPVPLIVSFPSLSNSHRILSPSAPHSPEATISAALAVKIGISNELNGINPVLVIASIADAAIKALILLLFIKNPLLN